MGTPGQPDFVMVTIAMSIKSGGKCPELKSVKEYFVSFRGAHISYERLVDTIWEDFNTTYNPQKICVKIVSGIRGGMSSRIWCGEEIE